MVWTRPSSQGSHRWGGGQGMAQAKGRVGRGHAGVELVPGLWLWRELASPEALFPTLAALLPLHQTWCLHPLPLAWMFTSLPLPLCNCQRFLLIHENTAAAMPRAQ